MSLNYTESDYYDPELKVFMERDEYLSKIRTMYMVTYFIMFVAGVVLNSYVIVAVFRKFRSNRNLDVWDKHNLAWVSGLAVTHLVFSCFLVLQFLYAFWHFNWHAGKALCKLSSYVFYFSMFTTAALLSLTSVSSCIKNSECSPGICANQGKSMVVFMVLGSWTFGVVLSIPSLLSRELRDTEMGSQCIDDYDLDEQKTTDDGLRRLSTVVLSRFLLGVLFPMFVMIISACVAKRQVSTDDNNEGALKRISCLVKVAYFICWTPLLSMGLIQVKAGNSDSFKYGLPAATVLATAHCIIFPIIYLPVGCKTNKDNNPRTQRTSTCKDDAEKSSEMPKLIPPNTVEPDPMENCISQQL